ncbi:hypothetical protein CLI75_12520, partial [Porphyromonas gingivalis]|uniref:hypothetical protein n=1 Tax=Porphyromonas gingivalis TaxID=837 RepID=UPI000BE756F1
MRKYLTSTMSHSFKYTPVNTFIKEHDIIRFCQSRKELLAKAQYAREKLQEAGFSTTDSTTPIVGILTPSYDEAIL